MLSRAKRLGLSFEVAPPPASHPNRTDIACFVGAVARRRAPADRRIMPAVLARWLTDNGFQRLGGLPVGTLPVSLSDRRDFESSLRAAVSAEQRESLSSLFQRTDRPRLARLVEACRDLTTLTDDLVESLRVRGFYPGGLLAEDELDAWLRIQRLHGLPVSFESFSEFERLFAWEARGVMDRPLEAGDPVVASSLGMAVRAFFEEGGRKCYVIRCGDPSRLFDSVPERFAAFNGRGEDRSPQLPGVSAEFRRGLLAAVKTSSAPVSGHAGDWVGIEHVYGLQDTSFVCLPDLVDACAEPVPREIAPPEAVATPESFRECAQDSNPEAPAVGRRLPPPRVNSLGLDCWQRLIEHVLEILDNGGRAFHRRDVQFIVSLPLTGEGRGQPENAGWLQWMSVDGGRIASARVQLAYPWLETRESADCAGGVEAPEGTLAGILARSALALGSYRSAARQPVNRFLGTEPSLEWSRAVQDELQTPFGPMTFAERVCLLGPSPRGAHLLSDVTCARDPWLRQGAVRRLINVVLQAARQAGDEFAFEPSGEALWGRVRERLSDLGRVLVDAGALSTDGASFVVRCGRDTMTQNDIDSGRLVAEMELLPAQPVQRIVVVLSLKDAQPLAALRAVA